MEAAALLAGAVDCHVHACPHLNARRLDVFEAVRQAAAAGLAGIGLMDNFANSAGYAALARRQLGELGVDVFGGIILEPPAGGVSADAVRLALRLGYGDGDGARFVSLPTHHTRHVARQEGRSAAYVDACFEVPDEGALPDPLPEILDLVAAADAVLNTGHVAAQEALALAATARAAGVGRVLVPAAYYTPEEVATLVRFGAMVEFSYFAVSPATAVPLTHVDGEAHTIPGVSVGRVAELIGAAGAGNVVLSSDCGVAVLPPPVEGLALFLDGLAAAGVPRADLRRMVADNPARLFRVRR